MVGTTSDARYTTSTATTYQGARLGSRSPDEVVDPDRAHQVGASDDARARSTGAFAPHSSRPALSPYGTVLRKVGTIASSLSGR